MSDQAVYDAEMRRALAELIEATGLDWSCVNDEADKPERFACTLPGDVVLELVARKDLSHLPLLHHWEAVLSSPCDAWGKRLRDFGETPQLCASGLHYLVVLACMHCKTAHPFGANDNASGLRFRARVRAARQAMRDAVEVEPT